MLKYLAQKRIIQNTRIPELERIVKFEFVTLTKHKKLMQKRTYKLPHFEVRGNSYFRTVYQLLEFVLLTSKFLDKNFKVIRFIKFIQSLKLFLISQRKIISVLLFLTVLFVAVSSSSVSSLAIFIITSFSFSWTLFLSPSKR